LLEKAVGLGEIKGVKAAKRGPAITHLMYANDLSVV
jgi:hypothetical protein